MLIGRAVNSEWRRKGRGGIGRKQQGLRDGRLREEGKGTTAVS
jgi:hypothetical protein